MTDIDQMIRFDRWANLQSIAALKKSSVENQRASSICGHIAGINEMWLTRAEGETATLGAWPDLTLAEAEEWIDRLSARWHKLIERTPIERMLTYCDSRGLKRENSLTELVQEVVLHASHHRGQIALLLRMSDHEPPVSTDFIPAARMKLF